ncbi:MAG TPA: DoxX family protein [Acidimicrobiales bacterium]
MLLEPRRQPLTLVHRVTFLPRPATSQQNLRGSWWPWLGAAKAAGAAGLLVGLLVPAIGVAAGVGLALYFTGAVITVARARWYSHLPYPLLYLAPVVGSLALAG